jgi:hypothetical protein
MKMNLPPLANLRPEPAASLGVARAVRVAAPLHDHRHPGPRAGQETGGAEAVEPAVLERPRDHRRRQRQQQVADHRRGPDGERQMRERHRHQHLDEAFSAITRTI